MMKCHRTAYGLIEQVRKPGSTTMSKQCMPYAKIKGSFRANLVPNSQI